VPVYRYPIPLKTDHVQHEKNYERPSILKVFFIYGMPVNFNCLKSPYFSCMKAATIHELKLELTNTPAEQLVELCVRLAKFKKENKELLTYLLFEAFDEQAYTDNIKTEMQKQFEEINMSSLYFVKKSLRKILRLLNKYIRYTGSAETEVKLLLHFCSTLKNSEIPIEKNLVIKNMYQNQLKKIFKTIATMHEDLQYEYLRELEQAG